VFEELDAFDPKWRDHYPTIRSAATAAQCDGLFVDWRNTEEGRAYAARMDGVPNYAQAIKAAQEAAERLPFNLGDV
jgi:hypothetical protein